MRVNQVAKALSGSLAAAVVTYIIASRPKNLQEAPAKQKRLVLVEPNAKLEEAKLEVEEADVPKPKSGQVLVMMAAAPVNPSDFGGWKSGPPGEKLPRLVGSEGSGIVIASGGGVVAGRLVGKRVGITARGTGSYQQYVCVDALGSVFELDQSLPVEDGASFFVNPYTAVGIIDTVKQQGQKIFIHTAAASQLGQMIVKVAPSMGVTVVNFVRRQEQAEMLTRLGAQHVIVEKEGWQDEVKALVKSLKIKVAFDCIAGEMTGTLVGLLPPGSTTFLYGGLSEKPVGNIPIMDLIYRNKQVKGWLLTKWLMAGGPLKTLMRIRYASRIVNPGLKSGGWASSQFVDCSLQEMWPKFLAMRADLGQGGFTGQKLRIKIGSQ